MNFERNSGKEQPEKESVEPGPELYIVPQTPEVKHIPHMQEMDIDNFLKNQGEIDRRKKDRKKPELNS